MTLINAVQKRLAQLMEAKSLSQYELSKISGVPQSTISTLLSSDFDSCKLSVVYQLSQYLCGGLSEFFNSDLFLSKNIESKYKLKDICNRLVTKLIPIVSTELIIHVISTGAP